MVVSTGYGSSSKLADLDSEVAHWRSLNFAETTKAAYSTHLRSYITFCRQFELQPLPAENSVLARYATFLARSKAYSTVMQYLNIIRIIHAPFLARSKAYSSVMQYLNIIRIIHLEFGMPNPLSDNWNLRTVTQGIKRGKASSPNQKAPYCQSNFFISVRN